MIGLKGMRDMKRKKPIYLIVMIAIVIACAVIAGGIIIINDNQNKKAIQAVENQMHELLTQSDKIAASAPDDIANQIGEFVYSNMTYQVTDVKDSGCIIRVNAPNLYDVFYTLYDADKYAPTSDIEIYNSIVEEILAQIYATLNDGKYNMRSVDVEVPLGENGKMEMTRELVDAMYGGLLTLQEEITKKYIEAMGG